MLQPYHEHSMYASPMLASKASHSATERGDPTTPSFNRDYCGKYQKKDHPQHHEEPTLFRCKQHIDVVGFGMSKDIC